MHSTKFGTHMTASIRENNLTKFTNENRIGKIKLPGATERAGNDHGSGFFQKTMVNIKQSQNKRLAFASPTQTSFEKAKIMAGMQQTVHVPKGSINERNL